MVKAETHYSLDQQGSSVRELLSRCVSLGFKSKHHKKKTKKEGKFVYYKHFYTNFKSLLVVKIVMKQYFKLNRKHSNKNI